MNVESHCFCMVHEVYIHVESTLYCVCVDSFPERYCSIKLCMNLTALDSVCVHALPHMQVYMNQKCLHICSRNS